MDRYNFSQLLDDFEWGKELKFLFFWGHQNKLDKEVGKFCLSQWYRIPFVVNGVTYQTSEHWMMACKALLFNDNACYSKIISSNSPGQAKEFGRKVVGFDEDIWKKYRFQIVKYGNIHKFGQHPFLVKYLLDTQDHVLVEASPVDTIWGIGLSEDDENSRNLYCWRGANLLGFALMEARDWLRDHRYAPVVNLPVKLPWVEKPQIHLVDMYWRMGVGEGMLSEFFKYYLKLTPNEQEIFKMSHILPHNWQGFLDD